VRVCVELTTPSQASKSAGETDSLLAPLSPRRLRRFDLDARALRPKAENFNVYSAATDQRQLVKQAS